MCCPLQFSYCLPCSSIRFYCQCKSTLPEASLASSLAFTCIRVYPFHTSTYTSPWSPLEDICFPLIHHHAGKLFVSTCYITCALEIWTAKKLNINILVFFWVNCKMRYSGTSQGCTRAGFYGNCRAVFSSVVSLCTALSFQPGKEGRPFPWGDKQKVGQHLPFSSNQDSSRRTVVSGILYLFIRKR